MTVQHFIDCQSSRREESPRWEGASTASETTGLDASPSSPGIEVSSKKASSISSEMKNCPLTSFFARRRAGMPPSAWLDSDEESEVDEEVENVTAKSEEAVGGPTVVNAETDTTS